MVQVKLFGTFKKLFCSEHLTINDVYDIKSLLEYLKNISEVDPTKLDFDNTLIAINDVDSNMLNGEYTKLNNYDIISIIPIIHGGSPYHRIQFQIDDHMIELMEISTIPFTLDCLRQKFSNLVIQIINSEYILNPYHAQKIISISLCAQKHNLMLSKELTSDIIMRFACTKQISKAINMVGMQNNKTSIVISIGNKITLNALYKHLFQFINETPFLVDRSFFLTNKFNISEIEINAVYSKFPLEDLLVERAATLF